MGIFADLRSTAKTIDFGGTDEISVGLSKVIKRDLERLEAQVGDADYPSGFDAVDEVHSIAAHGAGTDAGTYSITVLLANGVTFTTAALAAAANAATIQSAIDTAAAVVADYEAGDITAAGGPLTTTPVTLTFTGSVQGNHTVSINDIDLNDGGVPTDAGAVTVDTEGQTTRPALAILKVLGVITDAPPVQGSNPSFITADATRESNPMLADQETLRALAKEAGIRDFNQNLETELLRALNLRAR